MYDYTVLIFRYIHDVILCSIIITLVPLYIPFAFPVATFF